MARQITLKKYLRKKYLMHLNAECCVPARYCKVVRRGVNNPVRVRFEAFGRYIPAGIYRNVSGK